MKLIGLIFKLFLGLVFLGVIAVWIWPEKPYRPYQVSKAYQAQVDDFHIPPMPPDWIWDRFETKDGHSLRWGQTGNRGASKASLLIIPGYTATLDMYGEHVDLLARRGYHVIGLDLRGQGGSERTRSSHPEKLFVKEFRDYSDDVAAFIQSLDGQAGNPLIPVAMSFGGHVAKRIAADHPGLVDALYLVAPALEPNPGDVDFEQAKNMMNLARRLGKSERYVMGQSDWYPYFEDDLLLAGIEHCASSKKRLPLRDAVFTRSPEQRVGGITNQWGAEFFESSDLVRGDGYLSKINIPVQIMSAELDTFVITETNQKLCENGFPDCQDKQIAGTGHCMLQESDAVLEVMFSQLDLLVARIKP